MFSRSLVSFVAALAVFCCCVEASAQSGSRNAAPSFSRAPATTYSAPQTYQPAANPLATVRAPMVSAPRGVVAAPTQTAQPFGGGCPNCQLRAQAATQNYYPSAPVATSYAPINQSVQSYPAPVYSSAPVYSQAPVYSAPRYATPIYSQPVQAYRPTVRGYAPATRVYGGCGGY